MTVLRTTYPVVMESHARGVAGGDNSFNNESWRENPAIRYWEGHTPDRRVPAHSAMSRMGWLSTRATRRGPRRARITGPYGTDVMPVADFHDGAIRSRRWMSI